MLQLVIKSTFNRNSAAAIHKLLYMLKCSCARLAQLDRAPVFGTGGWGFKSLSAYFLASLLSDGSKAYYSD